MKVARQYLRLACALSVGGIVMYAWVLARSFSGHNQAVTLVSGYAMGAAAAVLISRPSIRISAIQPWLKVWHIVKIGLPAAFSAPMFWVISSMDRWLVAQFWGVSEAGIYSVAASISGIGLLFGAVVQTIWLTEASRMHNMYRADGKAILAERMKEICFLFALAWLALTAFSGEIIHLFVKSPFDQSKAYLPWLMTSVMLYSLFQALCVYLIIRKTFNKTIIIWLSGGILFTALSLLAANFGDSTDIAISQTLVYGLMLGWIYLIVRQEAGLQIKIGTGFLLMLIIIAAGIAMVLIQDVHFNLSHFIVRLLCFSIIAALVAWHFKSQLGAIVYNRSMKG